MEILIAILVIIMIIVFFVMSGNIGKIRSILEFFRDIELKKPENWLQVKCEKCGHEFKASKALKKFVHCPNCKTINKLP